jgi:hypothetical protein
LYTLASGIIQLRRNQGALVSLHFLAGHATFAQPIFIRKVAFPNHPLDESSNIREPN